MRKTIFKISFFIFGFLLATSVPAFPTTTSVQIHTARQIVPVRVAVANTPELRETGLMGVTDLQDDEGMLFVYAEKGHNRFWMKNTPTSLDILFLDSDHRIVFIAKATTPYSEAVIDPGVLTQFVLEVKAGFADRQHVSVGDVILWEGRSGSAW